MAKNDLIVLGGGTSGIVIALGALRMGWKKVILIERNTSIGGTALHAGCIPSKSLAHIAKIVHLAAGSAQFGLDINLDNLDLGKINQYINNNITNLAKHDTDQMQQMLQKLGGKIVVGKASFVDPYTVRVANKNYSARHIVIATGARSQHPTIKGLDQIGFMSNETIFSQEKLPAKLALIGNHCAVIEYAQAFSRLGSKVYLILKEDNILPDEDPELIDILRQTLLSAGIEIFVNSKLIETYPYRDQKVLECKHDSGETFVLSVDQILYIPTQTPNIEELALENAGVDYIGSGILVNENMQTSQKHIYAAGDVVCGALKLTNVAEYQAGIVVDNMILGKNTKADYTGFPYAIVTDPEYAQVGLTEGAAYAKGLEQVDVARFDFEDLDAAKICNAKIGRIKVITSARKIVGVSILGANASDLLAQWCLAIKLGATIDEVASIMYPYPSLSQVNRRVMQAQTKRLANGNKQTAAWMQRMLSWA